MMTTICEIQHLFCKFVKIDEAVWNFKHIVNYDKIKLFNSVNLRFGYPVIEIRLPKEFVRYENND